MADNNDTSKTQEDANLRAAQGGGVTSKQEQNVPHDVFNTSGSEPVRDKTPDPSKGVPVTRYFTKDGTPIEPTTAQATVRPDTVTRNDVQEVIEYTDGNGNVVTHDSLKAQGDAKRVDGGFPEPTGFVKNP